MKRSTSAETSIKNESALEGSQGKAGLGGTKTKGRQMSHKWVIASLRVDSTIPQVHKKKIILSVENALNDYDIPNIYHREIFMVTGKQYEFHDRSKGKTHTIQQPLIFLPDHIFSE